jgi:hypothetical protein
MVAIRCSEMLESGYNTTRCPYPEGSVSHGLPFTYFGGGSQMGHVCSFSIISSTAQRQAVGLAKKLATVRGRRAFLQQTAHYGHCRRVQLCRKQRGPRTRVNYESLLIQARHVLAYIHKSVSTPAVTTRETSASLKFYLTSEL